MKKEKQASKKILFHLFSLMTLAILCIVAGGKNVKAATTWSSSGTHSLSEITASGAPYIISGSGTTVTISGNGQTKNSFSFVGDGLFTVRTGAKLIIQNATFNGFNRSLVMVESSASLKMDYVNANNISSPNFGGVISATLKDLATIEIDHCNFNGNTSAQNGGVLAAWSYGSSSSTPGTVIVKNSTFTNNIADGTGGVLSQVNYNLTAENCTFTNNQSNGGGAIGLGTNEIIIKDCTFSSNKAIVGAGNIANGGAILCTGSTVTEISNTFFYANQAMTDGGALAFTGRHPSINIHDTVIGEDKNGNPQGNTASCNGGAMYANATSQLLLKNVKIRNNRADVGGGMYLHRSTVLSMDSSHVDVNTATHDGGGIFVNGYDAASNLTNSSINDNTTTSGSGGAIFITPCDEYPYNFTPQLNLQVGMEITGNKAPSSNAGGVYIAKNATVTVDQAQISKNSCGQYGGGVYNLGTLTVNNTQLHGNYASQGGGIYNASAADAALYMRGSTELAYNAAKTNKGGGLFAGELAKNNIQGAVKITNNYMNVSAINTSTATPTYTYSTGDAASNRNNAYLPYNSTTSYAALVADGALSAGASIGLTSSSPVEGRLLAKPDGTNLNAFAGSDASCFTHDAMENKTSELTTASDSTAQKNIVLAVAVSRIAVSFKNNYSSSDNTDAAAGISVEEGRTAGASWPSNPSRAGYLFIGWSTVRSPLTDTTGKMYVSASTISATSGGVVNNALTLYALWMEDADGNNIPDAMQVKVTFQAGTHGKLTPPAGGTFTVSAGVYTTYLWRGKMTDANYQTVMTYLSSAAATTAVDKIRECIAATASLTADMIPGPTADSGYAFDAWSPSLENLPEELNANASYTANFRTDTYTLTLDTHDVYPLLYSGVSSQDLKFTLKDGSGKVITDSSILNQVTFTFERTDGFEKLKDYDVVSLSGSKITAKKSGVVKIYAKYKDVVSSDFAVAVVPGDLDKSGNIELNDAVREAAVLRGTETEESFGTYGKYLVNMNNLPGVDVDDIVKIVSMVRNISDYYN